MELCSFGTGAHVVEGIHLEEVVSAWLEVLKGGVVDVLVQRQHALPLLRTALTDVNVVATDWRAASRPGRSPQEGDQAIIHSDYLQVCWSARSNCGCSKDFVFYVFFKFFYVNFF